MSKKVRLNVLGLSVTQLQNGAYALILAEEKGTRRIPVVIGEFEAQSIAIAMEGIQTPRPITHDLFVSCGQAFGIFISEVFIHDFRDGIFYSEITFCNNEGLEYTLDARTSDAVALAMRTGAPIYTTENILRTTGFVIDKDTIARHTENSSDLSDKQEQTQFDNYSIDELERTLATLIDQEEYEEAERVSEILKRKTNEEKNDNTDIDN